MTVTLPLYLTINPRGGILTGGDWLKLLAEASSNASLIARISVHIGRAKANFSLKQLDSERNSSVERGL